MKKDTVYIDIEDDITSIIDKINSSKAKVIALIPPKRNEVLMSVVNLKLLVRTAKEAKKTVVLVTGQKSLLSLAGGVGLHVADDLHSKPYIPESPDLNEDNSVKSDINDLDIDPNETIGELADKHTLSETSDDEPDESKESKDKPKGEAEEKKSKKATKPNDTSKKSKRSIKIPNFNSFRNKILIGVGLIVLLAAGWWYAFFVAPTASIAISAQTTQIETKEQFTVDSTITSSDFEKKMLKGEAKQLKKTVNQKFEATGERQVGEQASGTISVQNCESSDSITIPSGTGFSANDLTFISNTAVTVPGGGLSGGQCAPGVADVTVTAQSPGDEYNLTSGTNYSIAGQPSTVIGIGSQMVGGTNQVAKVVSQSDIDKAISQIEEPSENDVRVDLKSQFGDNNLVIDETFTVQVGDPAASPAVDTEASEGTVTVEFTYTLLAVTREHMDDLLEQAQKDTFDQEIQSVFDNGSNRLTFSLSKKHSNNKMDLSLTTTGLIGPKIDTEELSQTISGKRFSEVVETIEQVPGVTTVEVDLSPFWVFSAPRNTDKIDIQLDIADHTLQ